MILPRLRIGNIFSGDIPTKDHERVNVNRMDLQRHVLRLTTNTGRDVGFNLDSGSRLRHGDIMQDDSTTIVIYQTPEKVAIIKPQDHTLQTLTILGHIIGNLHRPIAIHQDKIIFPIQADSELELFMKLFGDKIQHIEIQSQVFIPEEAADVHGH